MNTSLSVQRNRQEKETLSFLEEITQIVTSKNFSANLLMQSYYNGLELFLHDEDDTWFDKLQTQIEPQLAHIPSLELNKLYTIIINHYIVKARKNITYYRKVMELYKLMGQYDFLCPEQYIATGKFSNIVTLGCHFQEFEWTKSFIETYKTKLFPEHRENIYHLKLGTLYFHQKEFETAHKNLIQVKFSDVYYTTDVRSLLLRIYYETEQYFALEQALDSFKDFIRRQKRLDTRFKKSYLRFVSILLKLTKYQLKYGKNKKRKISILEKVQSYEAVFHKAWLIEKIHAL